MLEKRYKIDQAVDNRFLFRSFSFVFVFYARDANKKTSNHKLSPTKSGQMHLAEGEPHWGTCVVFIKHIINLYFTALQTISEFTQNVRF